MFQKNLPKFIQQEIQYHLDNQDHESAKLIHDQWVMKNHQKITENKKSDPLRTTCKPIDLF